MKRLYKNVKKLREFCRKDKPKKQRKSIRLPENWSAELEKYSSIIEEPLREFTIVDNIKKGKEEYFIIESRKKIRGKNVKIALAVQCLRYLLGEEVSEEENEGYYFENYLPKEDAKIIITKLKNPSDIVPGQFKLELTRKTLGKETLLTFQFRVYFLNGNGFANSSDYTRGGRKSTWKCIYGNEYYMTDFEMLYCDTIIHKEYVKRSIEKLAKYLEEHGAKNHARRLRYRGETHDNSKIGYTGNLPEDDRRKKKEDYDDELHALSRIVSSKELMKDTNRELSILEKEAIQLHWKNNSHHPEHFESVLDMTTLDVMEMVCDWHARSVQWGTNLLEYAQNSQKNRFHFPEWMYQQVIFYCNILLGLDESS